MCAAGDKRRRVPCEARGEKVSVKEGEMPISFPGAGEKRRRGKRKKQERSRENSGGKA